MAKISLTRIRLLCPWDLLYAYSDFLKPNA
jgi:hypothetical protein